MDLRTLRHERGLTLEAVAVLGGIDPATVSRVERGLVQPHPETIVRLARALGVSARRMASILADKPARQQVRAG
jgi:transcriptional regulator with XRE-family HTH domain